MGIQAQWLTCKYGVTEETFWAIQAFSFTALTDGIISSLLFVLLFLCIVICKAAKNIPAYRSTVDPQNLVTLTEYTIVHFYTISWDSPRINTSIQFTTTKSGLRKLMSSSGQQMKSGPAVNIRRASSCILGGCLLTLLERMPISSHRRFDILHNLLRSLHIHIADPHPVEGCKGTHHVQCII